MAEFFVETQCWAHWPKVLVMGRNRNDGTTEFRRYAPERTCRILKTWSDSDFVQDWNYKCSECGGFVFVNERDPETGDVISAANYCSNCGAKVVR